LREFLTGRPDSGLLVFDNAMAPELVKPFIPAASGTKVVITSTQRDCAALSK
jgi:hypothetical protein